MGYEAQSGARSSLINGDNVAQSGARSSPFFGRNRGVTRRVLPSTFVSESERMMRVVVPVFGRIRGKDTPGPAPLFRHKVDKCAPFMPVSVRINLFLLVWFKPDSPKGWARRSANYLSDQQR